MDQGAGTGGEVSLEEWFNPGHKPDVECERQAGVKHDCKVFDLQRRRNRLEGVYHSLVLFLLNLIYQVQR